MVLSVYLLTRPFIRYFLFFGTLLKTLANFLIIALSLSCLIPTFIVKADKETLIILIKYLLVILRVIFGNKK